MNRPAAAVTAIVLALALALIFAASAAASPSVEQQLADRYTPALYLDAQQTPCGAGEAYRPTSVEIVLNRPGVVLRGPDGAVVKEAPSAADLYGLGPDYYLDLPGDPLNPGCSYEQQFRDWSKGTEPLVYAHVASDPDHPGDLALQYWFYYTFNDFTDKHESDWEMTQLDFHTRTVEDALRVLPYELDVAQHGGGERAAWTSSAVQKDGDRPVIYVATGSHADYLSRALYLGRSASEGFGCDNTTNATTRVQLQTTVLPDVPRSADSPFAWLAFEGRWGQKEPGFNNGPTGPAEKLQWEHPIEWAQSLRTSSVVVPAIPTLGTSVTSFFCGAVERGASVYNWALERPFAFVGIAALLIALLLTTARRTVWRPVQMVPLRRRRDVGQMLRAARVLYTNDVGRYAGIGLIFIPLSCLAVVIQWLLFNVTGVRSLVALDGRGPLTTFLALLIGSLFAAIATVITTAAVACSLYELQDGRRISPVEAFKLAFTRLRALAGGAARELAAVALLTATAFGIPLAIWLFIRWSLFTQACVLDGASARRSLRRSATLVRGQWWRTLGITAVIDVAVALL
ncbi:MAG: hypothetical protein ACLP0J_15910, partial [Solirubrobacteraceae bacterium]